MSKPGVTFTINLNDDGSVGMGGIRTNADGTQAPMTEKEIMAMAIRVISVHLTNAWNAETEANKKPLILLARGPTMNG